MTDYLAILKDKNLKATPQRLSVLKILGKHEHPTMDDLYASIKEEHPSISLATVYKNVNTLKAEGVIVEVNMPNGKMRYDIFSEPHIHVVCNTCGHVEDVSYDDSLMQYQAGLESKIGEAVNRLDVMATTLTCKHCS